MLWPKKSSHQMAQRHIFAADQTQAAQVENAVAACVEAFGSMDAAFNVAGISGRKFGDGPLHECSEDRLGHHARYQRQRDVFVLPRAA